MTLRLSVGLAVLYALGLVACDQPAGCVEGMSVACACSDGRMGAQTCTGGAFGACDCDAQPMMDGGAPEDGAAPGEDGAMPGEDGAVPRADGGPTPDGSVGMDGGGASCTSEDALRCGGEGVERCAGGAWTPERPCPASCTDGACDDGSLTCTPGATRCFRSSVQRCNREGTAWLFDAVCADGCGAGLCTGACTAGEARCNAGIREVCGASGWSASDGCALGCEERVCVEAGLLNEGIVQELRGTHVYQGCVEITLAGTLSIPAGEAVEIWARCLRVTASSSIQLGAGASLRFHARETIDLEGTASGGDRLFLEALDALTLSGAATSGETILRADALTITATGTTSGSGAAAALYGRSFTNDGTHGGAVSVMPPDPLESPTHPSSGVWNLGADELVVAWDRPFPTVMGYYVSVGDEVPGPGRGEYRTDEYVVLSPSMLRPGENRIRVVAVNADSEVGTYTEDLVVRLNVRPPTVTSTSHPDPSAWGGSDDVFLTWTDPSDVPDDALVGYWYAFDRMADTVPGPSDTFDDRNMLLLSDRAPGVWFFHIVNLDRLGRPSPLVAHYMVRVGPAPASGNVAGTITDASTGAPIRSASVLLNGGLRRASSGSTGDYTFHGAVPASSEPYRLTVRARGYAEASRAVTIGAGTAAVEHFMLTPTGAPPEDPIAMGWAFPVSSRHAGTPDVDVSADGRVIWSRVWTSDEPTEGVAITDRLGTPIQAESTLEEYYNWYGARTDVGAHDGVLFAVDYYKCDDSGSLLFGHGWSCLQMRTWDRDGSVLSGWRRWRNSGHTGSPSAVWNGSSYGVFFISYGTMYHRELTADLELANGLAAHQNDSLSSGHGDSRQFARTQALWDGEGYAVAWALRRSSADPTNALFFGRFGRDLSVRTARIDLGNVDLDATIGMADDGARTHLVYVAYDGARSDVVMRSIDRAGSVGTVTVLALGDGSRWQTPSLAYDGRFLYVTYRTAAGAAVLEARDPSDYALVQSVALGDVEAPRVAIEPGGAEGVVLFTTPSDGTWIQPFSLR